VFVGLDHQINAELVFKRIPKAALRSHDEFFAEGRRLHESRHRHVVPVTYAVEDTEFVYLAMPYFGRGSLQALLKTRCLTAREIVRLGLDFLMGLHHAHVRGVLHFDVKPTNVFVDDSGAALLADFGQSRLTDPLGTATAPPMYELHLPPEAFSHSRLTSASDIYQAGLTLYRMCVCASGWENQIKRAGTKLSSALGDSVAKGKFPDRHAFPEHIPTRLRTLITKAMNPDPDKRWPTVLDFMNQLCTVDGALDWQPRPQDGGGMVWELSKQQSGKRVELLPDATGLKWRVEVSRFGANPARLKSECLSESSEVVARQHARQRLGVV